MSEVREGLGRAARRLPELLAEVRAADEALPPASLLRDPRGVLSTGVGLSGGPARLLADWSSRLGGRTRFASLTELRRSLEAPPGTIVLFSQSFSPNARIAARVGARDGIPNRVAFTGTHPAGPGPAGAALRAFLGDDEPRSRDRPYRGVVLVPADEIHGQMVRLHAPATAAYAALRWLAFAHPRASWGRLVDAVPEAAARAFSIGFERVGPMVADLALTRPVAFVTAGRAPTELHQLAWKWTETLFRPPPPVLDALELAHGPLQALWEAPVLIFVLGEPGQEAILSRVAAVFDRERHAVVVLEASLPPPLSLLEHDALLNGLLLATLDAHPELVDAWPARGRDLPLYEVSD